MKKLLFKYIFLYTVIILYICNINIIYASNVPNIKLNNTSVTKLNKKNSPLVSLKSNGVNYDKNTWASNDVIAELSSDFSSHTEFEYSNDGIQSLNILENYKNNLVLSDQNVDFDDTSTPRKLIPIEDINKIKNLESGTIISQFYNSKTNNKSAIFSIGNSASHNLNFTIAYNNSAKSLNFMFRDHSRDEYIYPIQLDNDKLHTVALQADKSFGYRLFINGKMVSEFSPNSRGYKFFKHLNNTGGGSNMLNQGKIGAQVSSHNEANEYLFQGGVNLIAIYNTIIPSTDLLKITNTNANTWNTISGDTITISNEGITQILFREKRNNLIPRLQTETYNIKIDKVVPNINNINLNEIKEKNIFNNKVELDIEANTGLSGIKKIQYQLNLKNEPPDELKWINYDNLNKPIISKYFKGVVSARVINNADVISSIKTSTDFEVDIVNISIPISLTFAVYDSDNVDSNSKVEVSSPNYYIQNNGNRPIKVSLKSAFPNPTNNVTMVNFPPTSTDQLKIDIYPHKNFENSNIITIEEGNIDKDLGYISNTHNNKGYFNLDITPYLKLDDKNYIFSYNITFEFTPVDSIP